MRAGAGVRIHSAPVAVWGSLWELLFEGFEVQIGTHFWTVRGAAGDSFSRVLGLKIATTLNQLRSEKYTVAEDPE